MSVDQPDFGDNAFLEGFLRHIDHWRFPGGSEGERLRHYLKHRLKEKRKAIFMTICTELDLRPWSSASDDATAVRIMNAIWSAIEPAEIDACVAILGLEEIQRLSAISALKGPGIAESINRDRAWPLGHDLSLARRR